mmetsp:Transcript_811/g.1037  ORF Transcript_811/g.1037 Transcript_811/m.1037 type:complete len:231 (-) Transcript_811:721-1413(-)
MTGVVLQEPALRPGVACNGAGNDYRVSRVVDGEYQASDDFSHAKPNDTPVYLVEPHLGPLLDQLAVLHHVGRLLRDLLGSSFHSWKLLQRRGGLLGGAVKGLISVGAILVEVVLYHFPPGVARCELRHIVFQAVEIHVAPRLLIGVLLLSLLLRGALGRSRPLLLLLVSVGLGVEAVEEVQHADHHPHVEEAERARVNTAHKAPDAVGEAADELSHLHRGQMTLPRNGDL